MSETIFDETSRRSGRRMPWRVMLSAVVVLHIAAPAIAQRGNADAKKNAAAAAAEPVDFSSDLAKVLSERCLDCHAADRPRARLNLASYRGLMRGGDNGSPVKPGDPEASLLIQKLRGTADGDRMPQGGPPLDEETIARFEKWIREGAEFEGADPDQDVRQLAAIARARAATHEQLRAERKQLALANWRLVMPDDQPRTVTSDNFLLLGNVDAGRLDECAAVAESLVPRVAKLFRAPRDEPLLKGAMTLFVFPSRYDYAELARMVEKRDVDAETFAHHRYSIIDAYAALQWKDLDTDELQAVLGQQIAGLYVSSLGSSPAWFRRGAARAAAARLAPRSEQVAAWNDAVAPAFWRLEKPDDFLAGRSTALDADLLSYSFVQFLMSDARRFQNLLGQLRDEFDFDAAFAQSYGAAPEQLAPLWARRVAAELRRRGR